MPIITQREQLPTHEEVHNTKAPSEVKARILARMKIEPGTQSPPTRMAQSQEVPQSSLAAQGDQMPIETPAAELTEAGDATVLAPKEEAISPRMAALARREREITRRMQQFAADKKAWDEARAKPPEPSFDPNSYISKADLEKDLLGTLGKFGYNYDKIVETALNPQNSAMERELQSLRNEIIELKGGQTKVQEEFQSRQKLEYDQAVTQIRRDATATIAANPDYETIKESGSVEAVVKLIEKTFEDTGEMLSIDEAAAQVEEYLIEESLKVANYKKIKARLSQSPLETQEAAPQLGSQKQLTIEKSQKPNTQIQLKTLTNATRSSSSPARTEAERRARAIAIARGEKL